MAQNTRLTNSTPGLEALLRCPSGPIDVERDFDPGAITGFPGRGKGDVARLYEAMTPRLDDMQERLYASSRTPTGQPASVLVVLQGMDTAGKSGAIRNVIGMVDPQGVHIHAFKQPTPEELRHDFLWRVREALPEPGMIGIFDRSQYEDVLIGRVNQLAPAEEIEARYGLINQFERNLSDMGMRVVKFFLNVSHTEQRKRLLARLDDPRKYWKYSADDLSVRAKWDQYMQAYAIMLQRCNQDDAPWHVIASDHKWYRNWAIAQILSEVLAGMNLTWPPASFDVAEERAKVRAS